MVSKGGKVAIAFVVVLIVAAAFLIAWHCWKKDTVSRCLPTFDEKDASTAPPVYEDTDDEYEYNDKFAFDNLGASHCGSDVHACRSASCEACNPASPKDADSVFFIKSRNETKGDSSMKDIEEEGIEQEVEQVEQEAEQVEQEVEEIPQEVLVESKKRKALFASLFARMDQPVKVDEPVLEEPPVPVREVTVSVVPSGEMGEPESVEVEP